MIAMNREKDVNFLFSVVKEIRLSYECPVVLVTQTDYADDILKTFENLRVAHLHNEPTENVVLIIEAFHFGWLEAVQEVENWKKRAKDIPRDSIFNLIDYTIECIRNRYKCFKKFVANTVKLLTEAEKAILDAETDVIKDLRDINVSALLDKQRCLKNSVDKTEFMGLVADEINELLHWLDRLNNFLALQVCKLLDMKKLPEDLTRSLDKAVMKMTKIDSGDNAVLVTGRMRSLAPAVPDIDNINTKIKKLEDRISQLRDEKTSTNTLALQHKALFLEERIESLNDLRVSLSYFNKRATDLYNEERVAAFDNDKLIFNHLLPKDHRSWLVENLIQTWDTALSLHVKSLMSVMHAPTLEEFCDEYGKFTVDSHGRKIYKSESDNKIYQLDSANELVPVKDDEDHVYFYDALGRYYLSDEKVRVYKAYSNASEYMLDSSGRLLKTKETVDGVEYLYDTLGRYYTNDEGKRIYSEPGSTGEYKRDYFGNLVKIRYEDQSYLDYCPNEPVVTEESLYLKKAVGEALKKCVAEVCMLTPEDPVKYLAERLVKYHGDITLREERQFEEKEMFMERERFKLLEGQFLMEKLKEAPMEEESTTDGQRSTTDFNFMNDVKL